jgi:5-methylcytosine-specific restriction endonuclease McrBC regulatory subunit McrC
MEKNRLYRTLNHLTKITLTERGHTNINTQIWQKLASNPSFWQLVERKILRVSSLRHNTAQLDGACYVGQALFGDILLEIGEKVDGALLALLSFATRDTFRIERLTTPTSEPGALAGLLAHEFLETVSNYISRGENFAYSKERATGSLIGGRIDITRSLALRARGLRHLIAFDRNTLTYNLPKNRLILAAIREIEHLSQMVELDASDLARARALALFFEDCRDSEVMFGGREIFIDYAESLMNDPTESEDYDMLALASVILSHLSFEHADRLDNIVPRTWFINLEQLFERATRKVLQTICHPEIVVTKDTKTAPSIFAKDKNKFRAYPDLVLRSETATVAIGDVKYKEWSGSANEDEIYQLLVHASAFQSPIAFLVYPGDIFSAYELGLSSTGSSVWLFTIDIRSMKSSLREALNKMGLYFSAS